MFLWKFAKLYYWFKLLNKLANEKLTEHYCRVLKVQVTGNDSHQGQTHLSLQHSQTGEKPRGQIREAGWSRFTHMAACRRSLPLFFWEVFYKRLRAVSPHNAWVRTCKRNVKWGDKWELQPPDREWRRKNARWDGAEDPPLLRTRGAELTESLTEPVLTAIVGTEDLFADCCWQSERWSYLQVGSPEPG